MKVNNPIGPKLGNIESSKSKGLEGLEELGSSKAKAKSEGAKDLGGSAKVNLSERAQMMNKAKEVATNAPDNSDAKIARLQKMIDEGKYNINASGIADRLVDEHMMLPSE